MMKRLCALLCLSAALALPFSSLASGTWRTLAKGTYDDLSASVSDYTGTVTVTLLGDCTLGGEEKSVNRSSGFVQHIAQYGYEYPFHHLKKLTAGDDLTIANLEGVLTDRKLKKEKKTYNFSGPTAFTEILTAAEIECVTLANNHTGDYGDAGLHDTRAALEEAGVAWFDRDNAALWESPEGVRVGVVGVFYSLYGRHLTAFQKQVRTLRELGCAAVICVMHSGEEHTLTVDRHQKQIVECAVKEGVDLVVGHHPHVVQGFELVDGMPVVYSLGNCAFGGALHVKDTDSLVLQAELRLEEGRLVSTALHFYPITVTTDEAVNNYCPAFLTGAGASRVLEKMKKSTGYELPPFDREEGAVVEVPARN